MKLTPYEPNSSALCLLDMPSLRHNGLLNALNTAQNLNISCVEDIKFNAKPYKCEIGSAPFVLALLAKLADSSKFTDLDEGYLSAECCLGEEEALEITNFLAKKAQFLLFDENLLNHCDFGNIAYFMGFLCEKFSLKLACSDENIKEINGEFSELKELENFDGLVLCRGGDEHLRCSKQFLQIAKIQNNDEILIKSQKFTQKTKVLLDKHLQGTVGFLNFAKNGYDFVKISVTKV